MDLKKIKKHKKKYNSFQAGYNATIGYHVYRSENLFAPFSEWERITDQPISPQFPVFNDRYNEADDDKTYYYKTTRIDVFGKESAPESPEKMKWITDKEEIERKMETNIAGRNIYWSADPDLPLDQWKLYNAEPIIGENFQISAPINGTYYIYVKNINELGEEFGSPLEIQKLTAANSTTNTDKIIEVKVSGLKKEQKTQEKIR